MMLHIWIWSYMLVIPLCSAGNAALGKPTYQTGCWQGMTSDKAVDGLYYNGTSDHCSGPEIPVGEPAQWSVNLQQHYLIKSVTIYNTGDPIDYQRLNNFTIEVHNLGQNTIVCGYYMGIVEPAGAHVTLTCPHNTVGDVVKFVRTGGGPTPHYIPICELKVNAQIYEGCPLGYYGNKCDKNCGHCESTTKAYNPCEKATGRCINGCQVGWREYRCQAKLADVNRRSVLVPWLLFSMSCVILSALGVTVVYTRYKSAGTTGSVCHRSMLSSPHRENTPYRDVNLELEPSLSRETSDGQPYRRLQEQNDELPNNTPYDVIL